MKPTFFVSAAFTVALLSGVTEAAKLTQMKTYDDSFLDQISALELTQTDLETMSQTEIEARLETIADTFLENAVEGEVSADARAQFMDKLMKNSAGGLGSLAQVILPAIAVVVGLRLIEPMLSQLVFGGYPRMSLVPP